MLLIPARIEYEIIAEEATRVLDLQEVDSRLGQALELDGQPVLPRKTQTRRHPAPVDNHRRTLAYMTCPEKHCPLISMKAWEALLAYLGMQ